MGTIKYHVSLHSVSEEPCPAERIEIFSLLETCTDAWGWMMINHSSDGSWAICQFSSLPYRPLSLFGVGQARVFPRTSGDLTWQWDCAQCLGAPGMQGWVGEPPLWVAVEPLEGQQMTPTARCPLPGFVFIIYLPSFPFSFPISRLFGLGVLG